MKTINVNILTVIPAIGVSILCYLSFDCRSSTENRKHRNAIQYWFHHGDRETDMCSEIAYSEEYCDSVIHELGEPTRTVIRHHRSLTRTK